MNFVTDKGDPAVARAAVQQWAQEKKDAKAKRKKEKQEAKDKARGRVPVKEKEEEEEEEEEEESEDEEDDPAVVELAGTLAQCGLGGVGFNNADCINLVLMTGGEWEGKV